MTRASHLRTQATPAGWPRPQSRARAGYAAASWALLFAAPHFYWGVGGAVGLDTALNREIVEHRDGWFLALNWGIGLLCVAGGLVALATVRPRGLRPAGGPTTAHRTARVDRGAPSHASSHDPANPAPR